ncbi:NAD(P)-binding protein [Thelephora ganbajun]|uniref:NAD(P)-binding protein n=1 Tax=Thelephora ganbajun TaxID=370292 RepID=A0ACB6ZBU7_THEGA|nr:NAD(P)-binding protein [Thelephora ganbajun]
MASASATTPTLPSTQTVWKIVRKGVPAKALVKEENAPVPKKIPKGNVLVKIQAASLNPVGYKMMRMAPNSFLKRIAEYDFAGEVVDANGNLQFKVGDQVFGSIPVGESFKTGQGALAQYTYVPAKATAHRPEGITPNEASGIAIVALTAYTALYHIGKLEAGQRIFVNGGSTSVGIYTIQLAKALGCKVYASASGKNEEFLKSLGVDEFYDYTKQPIHEALVQNPPSSKFDVIFEAVGHAYIPLYTHSEAYLAPNGTYISVGPTPDGFSETLSLLWNFFMHPKWAGGTKRRFEILRINKTGELLDEIAKAITDGKVKPVIDSVYKFEDVLSAYDKILTGHARGKVVVEVS